MNDVDKISKEVKNLVESVKDSLQARVLTAAKNDVLQLNQQQLEKLFQLMEITFDESYQKAIVNFQKTLKKYLESTTSNK